MFNIRYKGFTFIATLITLTVFGLAAFLELVNTARWYFHVTNDRMSMSFPSSFYLNLTKTSFRFAFCWAAIGFLVFGRLKSARIVAILALLILVFSSVAGAAQAFTRSVDLNSFLERQSFRLIPLSWFGFLLYNLSKTQRTFNESTRQDKQRATQNDDAV